MHDDPQRNACAISVELAGTSNPEGQMLRAILLAAHDNWPATDEAIEKGLRDGAVLLKALADDVANRGGPK